MRNSKQILHIIKFIIGILIALFTLCFVLLCCWNVFGFRHFVVFSPIKMIVSVLLFVVLGAIGGYFSYLCLNNNLNLSVLFLLVPGLLLIFLFGGLAYLHVSGGTGSKTQDIADWGSYDCGVEEVLQRETFVLFPRAGSHGVAVEYNYEYSRLPFSSAIEINAVETVSNAEFAAYLQAVQNTYNIVKESREGTQTTFRIGSSSASYMNIQFDNTALTIYYKLVCNW